MLRLSSLPLGQSRISRVTRRPIYRLAIAMHRSCVFLGAHESPYFRLFFHVNDPRHDLNATLTTALMTITKSTPLMKSCCVRFIVSSQLQNPSSLLSPPLCCCLCFESSIADIRAIRNMCTVYNVITCVLYVVCAGIEERFVYINLIKPAIVKQGRLGNAFYEMCPEPVFKSIKV